MNKLLLPALLFCITVFAQKRERKTIELTPKVGFSNSIITNYANYSYGTNSYQTSIALPSANFGVTGDYYFSNRWSLRSGLLYQMMGGGGFVYQVPDPNALIYRSDGINRLNYLNIPVNANWHFGSTRKWNLNFGMTPGFLLSAKGDYPGLGLHDYNLTSNYKSFQLGLSLV